MLISVGNEYIRAMRVLRKSPGFVGGAALTLAIVIAANALVFSVLDALMFRSLSIAEPQRLVQLIARSESKNMPDPFPWSYPNYEDIASSASELFSGTSVYRPSGYAMRTANHTIKVSGAEVSGGFFHVIGLDAILGRTLAPQDDSASKPNFVVVLNKRFWIDKLGGDPTIIGNSVNLDGHSFTVIGVVDGGDVFGALRQPDVLLPIQAASQAFEGNPLTSRGAYWIQKVFARLKPEVSIHEAHAAVALQGERLADVYPKFRDNELRLSVEPSHTYDALLSGRDRATQGRLVLMIWGATWLLLVAAILNVVNLTLTRQSRNLRDMAVQAALGATPKRLITGLLAESSIVISIGAAAGCVLTWSGLQVIDSLPGLAALRPTLDGRILVSVVVVAILIMLLVGLLPLAVLRLRHLYSRLGNHQQQADSDTQQRLSPLLISQIGAAMMLMIGVGLISRSLLELEEVDTGFDPTGLAVAWLDFSQVIGQQADSPNVELFERVRETVLGLPGVQTLSYARKTPFDGIIHKAQVTIVGAGDEESLVSYATVDTEYFDVLDVAIIDGLGFSDIPPTRTNTVLINQAMADLFWPEQNAVGREFLADQQILEVVGIVSNFRGADPAALPEPVFYPRLSDQTRSYLQILIRVPNNQEAGIAAMLESTINTTAPGTAVSGFETMNARIHEALQTRYYLLWTLSSFAAISIVIALVGVFAIISYQIVIRQHEIGVRMAVGAGSFDIFRQLARYVLRLAVMGVILGGLCGLVLNRLLTAYVYNISTVDPLTYFGAAALIAMLVLIAGILPAFQAIRLNPARILNET